MKYAADFRSEARGALRGKWGYAILAGIISSFLGAGASSGSGFSMDLSSFTVDESGISITSGTETVNLAEIFSSDMGALLIGILSTVFVTSFIMGLAFFVLGSIIDLGYARYNLKLVDGEDVSIGTLFSYFPRWKTAIASRFLQAIYVTLWSMLFIIPGLIAAYRYSMTGYIIAEDENIGANDAITKSKEMMIGNKWRLFCLEFSFIGWAFLCAFTCGIGFLWLTAYEQAAFAAFYREVSGTGALNSATADGISFEQNSDGPTSVFYQPADGEENKN